MTGSQNVCCRTPCIYHDMLGRSCFDCCVVKASGVHHFQTGVHVLCVLPSWREAELLCSLACVQAMSCI
jgi:hypothetical protein